MMLFAKNLKYLIFIAFLQGCGLNWGSGQGVFNDAEPPGTRLFHGNLTGQNGQTTSGTAAIYREAGGRYWVRLESLVAPEEAALQVLAKGSGGTTYQTTLKGSFGNQTYATSIFSATTWTEIQIKSSQVSAPFNVYGSSNLSAVIP